jgi:acetyl-CoA C-acetyltransferase
MSMAGRLPLATRLALPGRGLSLHLLHALKARGKERGMATICIGGGLGGAMLVETC